ncbi:MAG: hypothetical protein BWY17_05042 [Deltaproteobacteria bacterium ADurb.Bin207]|nr:MAG: hypothetical protein BWY17_05042 [Deltaproteobacteria bacterium ADurb.Bin207]
MAARLLSSHCRLSVWLRFLSPKYRYDKQHLCEATSQTQQRRTSTTAPSRRINGARSWLAPVFDIHRTMARFANAAFAHEAPSITEAMRDRQKDAGLPLLML